jgi:glutamate carboxypeptidase
MARIEAEEAPVIARDKPGLGGNAILHHAETCLEDLSTLLRELVECESPSDDAASVNRFQELLAARCAGLAKPKFTKSGGAYGRNLLLDFHLPGPRRRTPGRILGVGHADTVWSLGTLRCMPFRRELGRLWGPGVLDMKAGLAFFLYAMKALRDLDLPVARKVSLWVVSDEEVGSKGSRARTEALAREACAVLVLEPGTGLEGKLKTARKGVGNYTIAVRGKAAHAGVDFEAGASATVELARQVVRVAEFSDVKRGLTVNPGVISGGTRTNVVAAEARAEVDIRVVRLRDAEPIDRKFRALKPFDKRCSIEVTGGLNRPPMERTPAGAALFQTARKLAEARLGRTIEESSTGGGSDGNFTAALGVPTLDGIGAVGEGAHAAHESILEDRIADRVALLALLVRHLGQ